MIHSLSLAIPLCLRAGYPRRSAGAVRFSLSTPLRLRASAVCLFLAFVLSLTTSAGERYVFRDERVEVVAERSDVKIVGGALLDITVTNTSPKRLADVVLELRFYGAAGSLVREARVPVFGFQGATDTIEYSAPDFSRLDLALKYTVAD